MESTTLSTTLPTSPAMTITKSPTTTLTRAPSSQKILKYSAAFWLTTAIFGQIIFCFYIFLFYYMPTLTGNFAQWNKVLPSGYIQGDTTGNLLLAAHLLLAALITLGGIIQVIPKIRTRFPAIHRWNGRVYITMAIIISLAGLYLIITRGAFGGLVASYALGLNGVLIIAFGLTSWLRAAAGNYAAHRAWALRLFLTASGVWFFRVGLMLWLFIFRAPVGFDPETFTGPFITFLYFGCYLLPLAFLESYSYAQRRANKILTYTVATLITIATLLMAFGILAATLGLWLPRMGG
jgi:hypothetical protein